MAITKKGHIVDCWKYPGIFNIGNNYLFVCKSPGGGTTPQVATIDISNVNSLSFGDVLTRTTGIPEFWAFAPSPNNRLAVVFSSGAQNEISLYDISDPTNIFLTDAKEAYNDFGIPGRYAKGCDWIDNRYIIEGAGFSYANEGRVYIWDAQDPNNINLVHNQGNSAITFCSQASFLVDRTRDIAWYLVFDYNPGGGGNPAYTLLYAYDVTTPTSPSLIAGVTLYSYIPGSTPRKFYCWDLDAANQKLYLSGIDGLHIIDIPDTVNTSNVAAAYAARDTWSDPSNGLEDIRAFRLTENEIIVVETDALGLINNPGPDPNTPMGILRKTDLELTNIIQSSYFGSASGWMAGICVIAVDDAIFTQVANVSFPFEDSYLSAWRWTPTQAIGNPLNALHLHFDEWPFIDSSGQGKLVNNDGVTITASAGVFDGASDLQIGKANILTPNTENWEVDFIIDHSSLTGTQTYYSQYEDTDNRCHLQHINGSGLEFLYKYDGVDLVSLTGSEITDSNEHHIALSKEGDTFKLFLDGILEDTTTYSFGNELIDSDIFIGQDGNSANYLSGAIRNFRISNITRFRNIFSPDTSYGLDTDENTHLLISFVSDSEDSSEAGLSIWNPRQVTRGNVDTGLRVYKFGNQCGYFPGTQDGFTPYSLRIPDNPNWYIGYKEFTLDTWVYPLSHFNYAGLMHQNTRWYWYIDSAGKLNFYIEDGSETFSLQTSGTVPLNEWSHIAVTRSLELTGAGNPGQVWRQYIKGVIQNYHPENFWMPNLTGPMWIGRGTSTSDLYHGYMDELRLLLNKAVWTEDEFWPWDYPYFSEAIVHRYRKMLRRRIHSIQGR